MKFGPKEKMRSMMFSNYLYGQFSKDALDIHFMNLQSFIIEYLPNLQILFINHKFGMIH